MRRRLGQAPVHADVFHSHQQRPVHGRRRLGDRPGEGQGPAGCGSSEGSGPAGSGPGEGRPAVAGRPALHRRRPEGRRLRLRRPHRRRHRCASRARTSRRSSPTRPPTAPSSVSRYLTDSDADRILGDVEDFGRRQPWAVIGGGVVLGLLASRFLKASSTRRYEERYDSSRAQLPARTSYGTPTARRTARRRPAPTSAPRAPRRSTPPPTTTPGVAGEPTYQGGR